VLHGDLDPGHREELDRAMDALSLSRDQENVLGLSAIVHRNPGLPLAP